jgi:chorismate-pyruvate lyase
VVAGDASILAPLASFYAAAGLTLPAVETVDEGDVPPALASLLRPPTPLTPRLEAHYGEALVLRVLDRRRVGDRYARRVVLVRGDGSPALLGAIELDLARLPAATRAAVLAETAPFGHVFPAAHARPDAIFRVACDAQMRAALGLDGYDGWLYGRRRTLVDERGAVVATIVDVLAARTEQARSSRANA